MKLFARASAVAAALLFLGLQSLGASANSAYAICENQTYALCASAKSFVFQEVSYAKCVIKRGDSISAPPLVYSVDGKKDICTFNQIGATNGFMASTFSLPDELRRGGSKALYTCPGGSTGDYAQCDGGTCFKSTTGQFFPGLGKVGKDEIICSCPITKSNTSVAPFGYQFVGPYPCQPQAFNVCNTNATNGAIIPVGAPLGAGRLLTRELYGQHIPINECVMK